MTTAPNVRNGNLAPDGPNLSSDDLYDYALVVNADWSGWAWRRVKGSGHAGWEGIDLSTVTGNPLALPIVSGDSHYILAGAPDGDRRFWCSGNQHNDDMRALVFLDHTDDWTNPANWSDADPYISTALVGSESGFSYTTFIPLPDGHLLWMMTQNDRTTSPEVLGRDVLLFEIGPGDPSWAAGRGTVDGHFATVNETDNDGDPERAYFVGACVSAEGRVGWFGSWMIDYAEDHREGVYYVEWDPDLNRWQTVNGTAVTLPLTYTGTNATSTYSACTVTSAPAEVTISSYPAFDENGRPHIVLQESVTNTRRRCYWDGDSWEFVSGATAGGLYLLKGGLWRAIRDAGTTARVRPIATDTPVVLSGTCAAFFDPYPDPRRLWSGELAYLVPDGNVPRVYTFGAGPRVNNT